MASLSTEEENYVRMCLLITGISPRAVRTFFDHEFAPVCLETSLQKEYNKLLDLKKKQRINQSQWNLLFPTCPGVPDSKTFDITLMITLLRNLTGIAFPHGGFDCLPTAIETTPSADLSTIKYYRNYISHLDNGKIESTDFNTAWDNLSGAVERLGGHQMKQECDQLRTKVLDQTNKEIMMDIKRSNHEISELKKLLHSLNTSHEELKADHAEINEVVKMLKTSQDDTVPWNVRVRIKDTLKAWKDNDQMFINTRAAQRILKYLKENSCVTITASSGVGKSFTLRHVALQMAEEEYDVLMVTDPGDIVKYYNPNKNTLFVVDDLCGNFSVDQSDIKSWKPVMEDIKKILENKKTKIIAACRLQIYYDEKFESLSVFKSCVCNLLSEEMCLLKSEKQSIAELYLKTKACEITEYYDEYDCFPLLCKLYCDNPKPNIADFFKNPLSVYEAEIDKLRNTGNYTKYCALALCIMFNNKLEDEMLTGEMNDETRTIIENTLEACRLQRGTSRLVLQDELETLKDTFVKKDQNMYKIIHDKIFDFLVYIYGQKLMHCLIKSADSALIKERFVFEKKDGMDQYITLIPPKYHQLYIHRMVDDWSKGKVRDVFSNINMKIPQFRQLLLSHLNTLEISYQKQIVHTCDTHLPSGEKIDDDYDDDNVLLNCCLLGDISLVQWCCNLDVDVNKCNYQGQSPLIKACEHGHMEIVKMLLDNTADCNKCDSQDQSPLMKACAHGYTEIVRMLLHKGVEYDKCDLYDQSPVMMACEHGHQEIVKMLLNIGADYKNCDKRMWSPVMMACYSGHAEIVKMFIDKDVDCNSSDRFGLSPLTLASIMGHTDIVTMINEHSS